MITLCGIQTGVKQIDNKINKEADELLKQDGKIGILATMDEKGCPHLSFISSIQGLNDKQITFGRFCEGLSKRFVEERPYAAFLALSADKRWLRGSIRYTHSEETGEVFDKYNDKPLFHCNAYAGFNRIYFFDLISIEEILKLPMPKILLGLAVSRIKAVFVSDSSHGALSRFGQSLLSDAGALKFLCWEEDEDLSNIVPIVQASPAGSDRIVFSAIPYGEDFAHVKIGAKAAILALNTQMQSVLVKGMLTSKGLLAIDRVYNSMPPKNEYIYSR